MQPLVIDSQEGKYAQSLLFIECESAEHQKHGGRYGVTFVTSLKRYDTVAEARKWLSKNIKEPYVTVIAWVNHVDLSGDRKDTIVYKTLFKRDV